VDGSPSLDRRSSLLVMKRKLTSGGPNRIGVEMKLESEPDTNCYDDDITEETLDLHRKAISFRERFKTLGASTTSKSRRSPQPKKKVKQAEDEETFVIEKPVVK
jgi:hypothetical protein